ncbi:hypothetical protein [Streptomyces sp. TP-A0356]|uniref:hypothetical protein n=1 Tax=Streptomyces sp. TP-A0356 TaxID=1359208 RepID=UPI0006E19F99|nr:hypothetical protein [Streptomyces sp. TP-A0356]
MGTETDWVYRVDEPHGSQGWHPYGDHPGRWRGTITSDDPAENAQYAAALVVCDLMTEWDRRGSHDVKHVRVLVWEGREGSDADAVFTVEIQPEIHGE